MEGGRYGSAMILNGVWLWLVVRLFSDMHIVYVALIGARRSVSDSYGDGTLEWFEGGRVSS